MTRTLTSPERRRSHRMAGKESEASSRVKVRPGGEADFIDASSHTVAIAMPHGRLRVGSTVTVQFRDHPDAPALEARVLRNSVLTVGPLLVLYRVALSIDQHRALARELSTHRA